MSKNYIIVGDACGYKGCLIYAINGGGLERAKEVLDRMLNNPNKQDLIELKKHTNIRIETVDKSDAWWNW